MKTLTVSVSRQFDGYTFGLSPLSKKLVAETLASERSAFGNVFVAQGTKTDFESQYGPIVKHILLTLLGVNNSQLIKLKEQVNIVQFEEPVSHKVLYKINLQDVEA
ncbi:hypothetical protein Q5H89_07170 [Hymenobacter sp. CA2-7]|nr:hypothetical protein [Hymenobacter sp. CA2-7]